jgi:membrane associated rhomboid family serine protease
MVVNVLIFALQEVNDAYLGYPIYKYLALSHEGLREGYVWQLLTFQFLHGGPMHLLFNLLGIYFFGRPVEERLGKVGMLRLYLVSGIVGGLLQALLGWLLPRYFGFPVVGASAAVYGLITAFGMLDPEGVILLFFILPLRAKYFPIIAAAIALFYILVPTQTAIAHAAHLGGILGGYAYLRWGALLASLFRARPIIRPKLRPRELMRVSAPKMASWQRVKRDESDDLPPSEFISREVDPILDKISQQGIHSLTPRERQILQAARAKMEKRNRGG